MFPRLLFLPHFLYFRKSVVKKLRVLVTIVFLPRPIHRGFRLLSSLPRLPFSSHRGEFAVNTFGKDKVSSRAD